MAQTGDSYEITIKRPHLEWGTHRYTDSRGIVYGEGYIAIPAHIAYSLEIYTSNGTNGEDILGRNIFYCRSADGLYEGIIRAQGTQHDDRYAKQFAGDKALKAIGTWYYEIGATIGDVIRVTWITPTEIEIEKL